MLLLIQSQALKIAKIENRASDQYHHDQQRAMLARAINPSLDDLANREPSKNGHVAQPPMRSVERITSAACDDPVWRKMGNELKLSPVKVSAPAMTGAPVNLSLAEFERLPPEDQTRIIRQVCAFEGARQRMQPDGSGRSLREALEEELAYQRAVCRRAKSVARDGKKSVISREQSKRDKKSGRPRTRAAGVTKFTRGPTVRVAASGLSVDARKLKRGESDLLLLNTVDLETVKP